MSDLNIPPPLLTPKTGHLVDCKTIFLLFHWDWESRGVGRLGGEIHGVGSFLDN